MARQAGSGLCLQGSYQVWSCSASKKAHSFCMTAHISMWILFQCYPNITMPLKIRCLHLLEHFIIYFWLNHSSLGVGYTFILKYQLSFY